VIESNGPGALILGTAQWGEPYGATNSIGRLSDVEIEGIVALAREFEILELDTAVGYGDAQRRIASYATDFRLTSKVSGLCVSAHVESSLMSMGLEALDSVLIHDWDAMSTEQRMASTHDLGELREQGVIGRVGVSVYDAAGLEAATEVFDAVGVPLMTVQVPANVLDRRLDESGVLAELAASGAHVVVRSVFLQGILLASGGGLADHRDVASFRDSIDGRSSALEACLGHVQGLPWVTHVVVGATSTRELTEIVTAWQSCSPGMLEASLASSDPDLIDPRRW
jgi:aryl-alcohol dehydrogenase-like predicted oxidoreductase